MAKNGMTRIEREKQTVQKMIELYCRHHLKQETMPEEYQHLAEFSCRRLDHCKYGENKTACKNCPTHCYAPKEREQIREIMRWAGPRMILYSPKDAIAHTFYNVKHWLQSLSFRTGVIVVLCCIPFYMLSFVQMLLPISVAAKGILWTVLFGLAKTCQYGGLTIWKAIETMHPEIEVWETCTPYFDRRNIHFYINRCGFHAVEFFNEHHPDPNMPEPSAFRT